MYAVAYYNSPGKPPAIFPNVFPDYDMAVDCVIFQIKEDYGDIVDSLETDNIGGTHVVYYEESIYVIGKLFNFNPKGA